MKYLSFIAAAVLILAAPVHAQTFTFGKGTPAQQLASVESVADFETFTGRTSQIGGTILVDQKKKAVSGTINVDATAIDTGIPLRNEHMKSAGWLDTEKYPTIKFTAISAKQKKGDDFDVTGTFELHGVTRTLTVPVRAKYIPSSDATKKAGFKGDVLYLKTSFPVKLSDYGIAIPSGAAGKVAETVNITLTAYGQTES